MRLTDIIYPQLGYIPHFTMAFWVWVIMGKYWDTVLLGMVCWNGLLWSRARPYFNKKTLPWYGHLYYADRMVTRWFYLYDGEFYTGKTTFFKLKWHSDFNFTKCGTSVKYANIGSTLNVYQLLNLKALNLDVSKLYAQLEFIPRFAMASCLWVIMGWIYFNHQLGVVRLTLFVGSK